MLAAIPLALALLLQPSYAVQVDWIEDDGQVNSYVVDHGVSLAECEAIRADLIGWHKVTDVQCVAEAA